jgi:legumain
MKSVLSAVVVLTSVFVTSSNDVNKNASNWAVLVAGSNGYYNYRHQADIAHSYQILTKLGGFPAENVIVMMYNDVVNSSSNPLPGQLFNEPGGIDVYGDIVVDYSGEKVTAENFLNVIQGIKKGDTKDGPVLESKATDNVFIYYSDHGATGLVAMPTGDPLYATDLIDALNYMYNNSMYSQLLFYLEACESGSMFDGILSNKTNVFATTAATPDQPSYAFYYNDTLSTYMADEYSIRWMQDSTNNWDAYESLIKQFKDVAQIVKESQPQKYGDFDFDHEPIEDFEAYQDRKFKGEYVLKLLKNSIKNLEKESLVPDLSNYNKDWRPSTSAMNSRDVKLAILQHRYLSAKDIDAKIYAASLVEDEMEYRLTIDLLFDELIKYVAGFSNNGDYKLTDSFVDAIKYGHIRPSNYQCLKYVYNKYEENCERFTDYSLKYVNTLVNLCEIFNDENVIEASFENICAAQY